jgi:hypothetical protein
MAVNAFSQSRPYVVDDLFGLPELGVRYDVLDGALVMTSALSRTHQRAVDRLAVLVAAVLPPGVEALTGVPVRLDDGDGPVPDVVVTTAGEEWGDAGLPVADVPTVMEVTSLSNRRMDRLLKPGLYAEAGIRCQWRVEFTPWFGFAGPLPVVVVRIREDERWREMVAHAGRVHRLPVAVGPVELVWVELDPASLVGPRAETAPGDDADSG